MTLQCHDNLNNRDRYHNTTKNKNHNRYNSDHHDDNKNIFPCVALFRTKFSKCFIEQDKSHIYQSHDKNNKDVIQIWTKC